MDAFLDKIALDIKNRFDRNTGDICIVLPNRRASLFLKKYLAKQFQRTIWAPETFSVEDFIISLSGKTLADPLTQLFELYSVHLEQSGDKAQDFDSFANWAQVLLSDFNEIDLYLADAKQVFSYLNEAKALQFWNLDEKPLTDFEKNYLGFYQSLYKYYEGLKSRLLSKHLVYQGLAYRLIAEDLEGLRSNLPWKKIIFAGLNALSTAEEKIIQFLVDNDLAEIIWDADPYYVDDPAQEAGNFIRRYMPRWSTGKPRFLEENFLQNKQITITGVARNTGQARLAGQLISELLEKGTGLEDTAVVLADEKLLLPLLNSLPPDTGDINITMGFPISLTPLYRLIKAIFQLQENAEKLRPPADGKETVFYARDIIGVLMHPYISIIQKDAKEISQNNLNLVLGQIRNSNKIFYTIKDIYDLLKSQDGEIKALPELLFSRWQGPSDAIDKTLGIIELLRKGIAASDEGQKDMSARIEMEYLFHFNKIFMRGRTLLAGNNAISSLRSLRRVLVQILDSSTIPFFGEPLKGLQIMGVLETRALDFKNIILLSANEGILPSGRSANTFIPFDVKKNFLLPTHNEKDAVFAYHFYRLLQRAENIHLVFDTEGDQLGGGEKSRFITQLAHELPKYNPRISLNEEILRIPPLTGQDPYTIEIEKSPELMERLAEKAAKGFSPTALNTYINCSLQFYFKELAGLSELEEIEETIEANTLGSVIHEVLKELYDPLKGKILIQDDIKGMKNKYKDFLQASFTKNYKDGDIEHGKNYLLYRVASLLILQFLESEENILKDKSQELQIVDLEKSVNTIFQLPDSKTGEIRLKGFIDRIDRLNGELRIIDYKTGMVNPGEVHVKEWENIIAGPKHSKALQLLMYAFLLQKDLKTDEAIQTGNISLRNISRGFIKVEIPEKAAVNQASLAQFGDQISILLKHIFDKEIPFSQTEDEKNCQYCPYKPICNRN